MKTILGNPVCLRNFYYCFFFFPWCPYFGILYYVVTILWWILPVNTFADIKYFLAQFDKTSKKKYHEKNEASVILTLQPLNKNFPSETRQVFIWFFNFAGTQRSSIFILYFLLFYWHISQAWKMAVS